MEVDNEPGTSRGAAAASSSRHAAGGEEGSSKRAGGGKAGRGTVRAGGGGARGRGGKGRRHQDGRSNGNGDADDDDDGLTLVEKLAVSPYSSELHLANIAGAASDEEREEARAFMAQMIPLTEEQWLDWINDRKLQVGSSLEGKVEILELYKRACGDSLSIKLHQDYATFVLSIYFSARGYAFPEVLQDEEMSSQPGSTDESAAAVFDEEFVDGEMASAVDQSVRWHLAAGRSVWLILHSYEQFRLKHNPSAEGINRMESVYLERLGEPHLQIAETHQLYSTFISTYKNLNYEESMVNSQSLYAASKAIIDSREVLEDRLASSADSREEYQSYLEWEQEVAKPDFLLVKVLYQRALTAHPLEASFWTAYTEFLTNACKRPQSYAGVDGSGWSMDMLLEEYNRAARWVPFAGDTLSSCIRGSEILYGVETSLAFGQAQYDRVISAKDPRLSLQDLTSVVIAYADTIRHAEVELEDSVRPTEQLTSALEGGIAKVKALAPETGDPHLHLEKYLLRQYERTGNTTAMDAVLASLGQSYPSSALILVLRTDYLLRQNKIDTVRKLFQGASKKRFDYPEYVFDAWASFEHRDGTSATLDKALSTIKHEMTFVEARRQRENRLQQVASEQLRIEEPSTIPTPTNAANEEPSKKRRLDGQAAVDSPAEAAAVSSHTAATTTKTAATVDEGTHELKRDRENSTVSVAGLSAGTDVDTIKKLFRDCGPIREVKLKALGDQAVATIEFVNKESVPAAVTKDKKRIDDQEVHVAPVWQSTLYVTNFPEHFDAEQVQRLFEPFGTIFETRWPSRRLKATRRFVYVQYIDSAAAQRALALHNTVLEEGSGQQRLQVLISNPQHRQIRTDANASKRELFITGLPKSATESDLEKLFSPFGSLRGCRVLKDDNGQCKGAGFVDFETEQSTSAALSMNNHEFKKRRLAVVMADSRVAQKSKPTASGQGQRTDVRNRSIQAVGLPSDAEEPLVQQFFDRFGATSAIELQGNTAIVTFASPADAAKILLSSRKLDYNGHELTLEEMPNDSHHGSAASKQGSGVPAAVAPFLPRAGRGRGRKLGVGARRSTHGMEVDSVQRTDGTTLSSTENTPSQTANGTAATRSQADFKAMLLGKDSS